MNFWRGFYDGLKSPIRILQYICKSDLFESGWIAANFLYIVLIIAICLYLLLTHPPSWIVIT